MSLQAGGRSKGHWKFALLLMNNDVIGLNGGLEQVLHCQSTGSEMTAQISISSLSSVLILFHGQFILMGYKCGILGLLGVEGEVKRLVLEIGSVALGSSMYCPSPALTVQRQTTFMEIQASNISRVQFCSISRVQFCSISHVLYFGQLIFDPCMFLLK